MSISGLGAAEADLVASGWFTTYTPGGHEMVTEE